MMRATAAIMMVIGVAGQAAAEPRINEWHPGDGVSQRWHNGRYESMSTFVDPGPLPAPPPPYMPPARAPLVDPFANDPLPAFPSAEYTPPAMPKFEVPRATEPFERDISDAELAKFKRDMNNLKAELDAKFAPLREQYPCAFDPKDCR